MARSPLEPAASDLEAADVQEASADEGAPAQLEEETGLDLSEARAPEDEPVMDDEESARVVQAPD